MTSVRIFPNQTCGLCSERLLIERRPCILITSSARIIHESCLHALFPGIPHPPGVLLERGGGHQRIWDTQASSQIKRWVYIVAFAVSILAFGILPALPSSLAVTEIAYVSAYLLNKTIDYYMYCRSARMVQFG